MEENTINQDNGSSVGPVIGTIIILAVIVLGGFYFWNQRESKNAVMDDAQVSQTVQDIKTQSQSDAPSAIMNDLNATDVNNIDSQLNGTN